MEAHGREVRLSFLARELILQGGDIKAWNAVLQARQEVRGEIRDLTKVARVYGSLT
jgi:hypothetical protein